MQVGDVYRDDPAKFSTEQWEQCKRDYGTGPFVIIRVTYECGGDSVYVKSLEDGKVHGPWTPPRNWGVLDAFLTAVHRATKCK